MAEPPPEADDEPAVRGAGQGQGGSGILESRLIRYREALAGESRGFERGEEGRRARGRSSRYDQDPWRHGAHRGVRRGEGGGRGPDLDEAAGPENDPARRSEFEFHSSE